MRVRTALAWVIAAAIGVALVMLLALDEGAGPYRSGRAENAAFGLAALASTAVELLLAVRRPANRSAGCCWPTRS